MEALFLKQNEKHEPNCSQSGAAVEKLLCMSTMTRHYNIGGPNPALTMGNMILLSYAHNVLGVGPVEHSETYLCTDMHRIALSVMPNN